MTADNSEDVQVLDDIRAALKGLNEALAGASKRGIRVEVNASERKYVSQTAPQTTVSVRATRMRTEVDERF